MDVWKLAGKNIRQAQMTEPLPQLLHKRLPHLVHLVVRLKLLPLVIAGIPTNWRHVDHAVAELQERAALDGDVEVGDVVQDEVDQLLVLLLADPLDEAGRGQRLTRLERRKAVLGEAEVEEALYRHAVGAQLFLLLGQVGTADVAYRALLAEAGEEVQHLGGHILVEEAVLDW
jgi:hypothetical protein